MIDFVLILALIFICIISWILANIVWQFIYSKMMVKFQNQKIDALYAKLIRLIIQAKKDLKGGGTCDNL